MSIQAPQASNWDDYIALRRDIHRHPELGFEEHRTAALVAARLKALGYVVTEGIAGTGLVGSLRHGASTRSIGLRADMDALPIQETNDVAWASRKPNRSEEHTSELQSLMRISYAVFCLKKKTNKTTHYTPDCKPH